MASMSHNDEVSNSDSKSRSFIDPTQMEYLKQLWSQAGQAFGNNGMAPRAQANPFMQGLQQFAQPNNAMAEEQVGMLRQNLGDQFNNQILPGISQGAQVTGTMGGGRQGVAQGLAVQGMQKQFVQGAADIYNNSYNQAQQANEFGNQFQLQNQQVQQQMQLAPWQVWAGVLGNANVLNRSKSSSDSLQHSGSFSLFS